MLIRSRRRAGAARLLVWVALATTLLLLGSGAAAADFTLAAPPADAELRFTDPSAQPGDRVEARVVRVTASPTPDQTPTETPASALGPRCVVFIDEVQADKPKCGRDEQSLIITFGVPRSTPSGPQTVNATVFGVAAQGSLVVVRPVVVPRVVGLLYTQAARVAQDAGLTLCRRPKGLVVRQNPQPGATLPSDVCLDVVTQPLTRVPDLRGKDLAAARSALQASKLFLRDPLSTTGVVVGQDPAPATVVNQGSGVSVTLVVTPKQISVPDVVGRTVNAAQNLLGPLGLRLSPEGADPRRVVATQAPKAGALVRAGSPVTVTLRPPTVAVPDVRDKTLAQARTTLTGAGLTLGGPPLDADSAARIDNQSPAAGTLVAPGTTVSVTLEGAGPGALVLRIGGTGGLFALGIAAGLVAARLLKGSDSSRNQNPEREPDPDPLAGVHLQASPDDGLAVRLVPPREGRARVRVRLEPRDEEPVNPVLLEVSS